ncbi:MAG: 3-phosphoshikimate 1-carboxyvinyltransferase [Oscillospiraceae bacterium]|nr:3-phosphoshikimate 1-carboxyvinyltransferase [Oscillospiraceae bacterium]
MDIRIVPGQLNGTVAAPVSKSELHRYLICAAFSDGPTVVDGVGEILPDDIKATVSCLEKMGASFRIGNGSITVFPSEGLPEDPVLDCSGSGSTLRFLLPVTAALCGRASFTGNGSLAARPVRELLQALEQNGARYSSGQLPLAMETGLDTYDFRIPGNISSQYVSGLLMAGAVSPEGDDITLTSELGSAGYVDMTAHTLKIFGVEVSCDGGNYHVTGPLRSPGTVSVKGSWSAAAGILAAAAVSSGSDVTVTGLDTVSLQPDRAVLDILLDMGAEISVAGDSVSVNGSRMRGTDIDVDGIPDLFPVLAAVSAGAEGRSVFRNASRLRYKESDRLDSMHRLMSALGVFCSESEDRFEITGNAGAQGGEADACGDHRIAMAAAVAAYALRREVTVHGAENVSKSYPGFFDDLRALGGSIYVI